MTDQSKHKNPYTQSPRPDNSFKLAGILGMSAVALVGLFVFLKTYNNQINPVHQSPAQLASASPTAGSATTQTYPNQTDGTYAPTPTNGGNNPSNTNPSSYGNTLPGDSDASMNPTTNDMGTRTDGMGAGTDMNAPTSSYGTPSTSNNGAPNTAYPGTMDNNNAVGGSLSPTAPPSTDNRDMNRGMTTTPSSTDNSMNNNSMNNNMNGNMAVPADNDAINNQGPDTLRQ